MQLLAGPARLCQWSIYLGCCWPSLALRPQQTPLRHSPQSPAELPQQSTPRLHTGKSKVPSVAALVLVAPTMGHAVGTETNKLLAVLSILRLGTLPHRLASLLHCRLGVASLLLLLSGRSRARPLVALSHRAPYADSKDLASRSALPPEWLVLLHCSCCSQAGPGQHRWQHCPSWVQLRTRMT